MNRVIMTAGLFLGMRRIFYYRRFDEMPIFYHHTMALLLGALIYLLKSLSETVFPGYLGLLETLDLASFLTVPGFLLSATVIALGCVLFKISLEFTKHCKVLLESGMRKSGHMQKTR